MDSTLSVAQSGIIKDVNVRIVDLEHSFDGDLRIELIGPDSTVVVLANQRGGSGNNFLNTVFNDEAATPISSGSAPFSGSFRPEGRSPHSTTSSSRAPGPCACTTSRHRTPAR